MAWVIGYAAIGIGVAALIWIMRTDAEEDDWQNVRIAAFIWPVVLAACVVVVIAEWATRPKPPVDQ
jgi:NADH:ubiquinone oxidoreductase subunit 6 (subunit J)